MLFATEYDRCDVCILGGGFGGLYTALAMDRLSPRRGKIDICLVDPSDRFVFLPLLYDLTMGTASAREVCPTYQELLEGTNVRHVKATWEGLTDSADGSRKYSAVPLKKQDDTIVLSFDAAVIAVGATPQAILEKVEGAMEHTQPFYSQQDAYATRDTLFRMEQKIRRGQTPKIAVIGGGYGGVELSACLARRLPEAHVSLLTRGRPMEGTRAETLVDQALKTLGVAVEMTSVDKIVPLDNNQQKGPVKIYRSDTNGNEIPKSKQEIWDVVFWTAGSASADPVPNHVTELVTTDAGRLAVDETLKCTWSIENLDDNVKTSSLPSIWALGDCAEIVPTPNPAVPRTAQAAIQQADVVAYNVVSQLQGTGSKQLRSFQFQDLGTVLSLGGPNGAVLGPNEGSTLGPLLVPILDTARMGLSVADSVFASILNSPAVDRKSQKVAENLGLSLGGYGLGVDPDATPGAISGTLSGISRRAIYSLRMPTNKQRAYAAASSFLSSAAALVKEASDQYRSVQKEDD
jgi:NADH dehydrogenase FAD-containing subunit